MPNYRRIRHPGGTYFFTVNLLQRNNNDLLIRRIDNLREAVKAVRGRHPFTIHGWIVLPDHLHCIMELPKDDVDYSLRWRLIKIHFSKSLSLTEQRSAVRLKREQDQGVRLLDIL